jgi:hypothetical protein
MIGFIALAGIIVRNSILIVDFTNQRVRAGEELVDAVIASCRARTRPILITAFALMGGSMVILSDPIFQGMAVSLFFGIFISTILTLLIIPLGCISAKSSFCPSEVSTDVVDCEKIMHDISEDHNVKEALAHNNDTVDYGPSIIEKFVSFLSIVGIYIGILWVILMSVMPKPVRNFFEKVGGFLSIVGIYLGLLLSTVLNWFKSDEKVKPDDEAKAATVTPKSPVEVPAASQVKTNDFKTSDDVVKETGGVPVEEEKPTTKKVTKSKAKPKPAVKKVEKAKVAEEKEMATPKKIVTKKKESSKKMARRGIKLKKDLD